MILHYTIINNNLDNSEILGKQLNVKKRKNNKTVKLDIY